MFNTSKFVTFFILLSALIPLSVNADSAAAPKLKPLQRLSIFQKDFAGDFSSLIVQDVSSPDDKNDNRNTTQPIKEGTTASVVKSSDSPESQFEEANSKNLGAVFVGNFKSGDLLPPDETPRIRINSDAPSPFVGMAMAHMEGDNETAAKYADQWVRYQQNFIFEVRELTRLVGEALIRQKAISEDDWQGVSQYIDYETAMQRKAEGSVFKATHEQAMARIKPDPKNEAGVYYFFHMNCGDCRIMTPDVERLNLALKNDAKVRMVALTLGPTPQLFINEYQMHTGLTLPIFDGQKVAKQFGVGYSPAVVVVAPNTGRAYLKSGRQSFERMYEFVRRVQGLPANLSPEITKIAALPIGEVENRKLNFGVVPENMLRPKERERLKLARRLDFRAKGGAANPSAGQALSEVKF